MQHKPVARGLAVDVGFAPVNSGTIFIHAAIANTYRLPLAAPATQGTLFPLLGVHSAPYVSSKKAAHRHSAGAFDCILVP